MGIFLIMLFIFSIILDLQCSVSFLLYSKMTQSYTHTHIFFSHIILHHAPLQVSRYSDQCYTAGSHCLSIPNAIVCGMGNFFSINYAWWSQRIVFHSVRLWCSLVICWSSSKIAILKDFRDSFYTFEMCSLHTLVAWQRIW